MGPPGGLWRPAGATWPACFHTVTVLEVTWRKIGAHQAGRCESFWETKTVVQPDRRMLSQVVRDLQ